MLKSKLALRVGVLAALVAGLAGCGSSTGSTSGGAASSNSASSSSSGAPTGGGAGLVIYGNPPAAQFKPVLDAFAKAYPAIKVSYSDQDDNVSFAKYRAEHAQGARTADIIIASSPRQWDDNRDIALNWTPTDTAAYPAFFKQFPGVFIFSPDPAVSIYSKAKLPAADVPATFAQLESDVKQHPNLFNKKLATYTVDNQFGYSAFWGLAHRQGWSVLDALGPATKPQADGTAIVQQLATGASNYGYFESGLVRGALTGAVGQIVGWEYMRDFTPLVPRGVAITKGAANPAAAKTFLNWVYSAPGQRVLCAAGFTAFRTGISCPDSLAAVQRAVGAAHVFLVPFHSTIAQDQTAFDKRWHQAFG
ncbi:MAG TPA: extracellular solute-binding protein [Solirubrobacteraceae bacterium]|nr:extracellular solute-binding protein [Solirubrobacteraceae bacterium]